MSGAEPPNDAPDARMPVDLVLSPNPTLIFAADLATIRHRTWLLLNHSDLSATIESIGGTSRDIVVQGGVCVDARLDDDGRPALFGRYDRGAMIPAQADTTGVHRWYRIDVLAYCLNEESTARLFGAEPLKMRSTRPSVLGRLATGDPYAGTWAKALMPDDDYRRAADPRKRARFLERLEQALPGLPCVLLPFQGYGSQNVVALDPVALTGTRSRRRA
ncbi:MAG: hypothetical protein QM766_09320 [Burkholderiaceae bacterium]